MWTILLMVVSWWLVRRLLVVGALTWLYLWFLDFTKHITSFGL